MINKDVSWEQLAWGDDAELLWETFHENSKATHYDDPPSTDTVYRRMLNLKNSLEYESFPAIVLPGSAEFPVPQRSLYEAITTRVTPVALRPVELPLATLAAILHHMYGINRSNVGTRFPRPFRNVPSGGGLFPLEIYFHTPGCITGLERGVYHYNAEQNAVRRVIAEDVEDRLAAALFQPQIARSASAVLFQTALFGRNAFKYRDRGYRFTLIEAGHVAQNLNLVATALGLSVWNIGGYIDAEIDALLGIDGVNHSTLYLHAIGGRVE